ncbi:MAG: polymerase protein [Candidatus Roizmanbacteria bacterium GW2011_GWA2_36_23]|uniref:Polymerase protein n=1 Tax=Candidatus Roizmanbacteria bacterium GW2011_GWA2_36_23 TaxID=1618480 RepID=A0A0G0E8M6_9BACT|nr:MAG: polymerase protein [Candidatus Roizmanbacteria bacterium GW2011_GWA2_36_23]
MLLIIDGNALMHRAFHALPQFATKKGIPTNAIYGFFSILHKAVTDYRPQNLAVCFDTPVPTFRKKIFKEYQSHRPKMEDKLACQFSGVKEGLDAAGILRLEKEGFEADDVIGTISSSFSSKEDKALILSGDKDILQLVNNNVFVITPQLGFSKEKIYDPDGVKLRFGIEPRQIPEYKALMGDQSDNYKGAKGIGPKTAADLLNRFDNIDNIYRQIDQINGKIKDILIEHKENIFLSKQLATILTDIDIKFDMNKAKFNGYSRNLEEFFLTYEITSLLKRMFPKAKSESITTVEKKQKKDDDQIGLF